MRKQYLLISILSISILASCKKDLNNDRANDLLPNQPGAIGAAVFNEGDEFVPNELIIKFKKGTSKNGRENALLKANARAKKHLLTKAMQKFGDDDGLYLIQTPQGVADAVERFKQLDEVEFAEPNYIYHHDAITNDPSYLNNSLWGMYGPIKLSSTDPINQFGSQANIAWSKGHRGSKSVIVAVIDEGIDFNHPDLMPNIWTNPYEVANDKIDNDGNGYVDDIQGFDFANGDNTIFDGTPGTDVDKHGTHVAGTIGAIGNNSVGVVGVNWNVSIISCKFLGVSGGTLANAILALDYLTALKINHPELNIVASNNSWGGGPFSQGLYNAITRGAIWNILFIGAAGNNGRNNDVFANYPSNYNTDQNTHYVGKDPNGNYDPNFDCTYDAVIAVAALEANGALANYSNYGSKMVDLGAPGSNINSTLPFNTYGALSGTSMATPHVTGAAALYAATYGIQSNSATNARTIKDAIIKTATSTSTKSLSKKCVTQGRLNASTF